MIALEEIFVLEIDVLEDVVFLVIVVTDLHVLKDNAVD